MFFCIKMNDFYQIWSQKVRNYFFIKMTSKGGSASKESIIFLITLRYNLIKLRCKIFAEFRVTYFGKYGKYKLLIFDATAPFFSLFICFLCMCVKPSQTILSIFQRCFTVLRALIHMKFLTPIP